MSLEKLIEFIFGAIILGTLGFLATQVFDMKGTLSSVSTKIEATDNRVSRIAEVLPEVKARVAWEEVNEPFKGFVLTTNPKEVTTDKWETVMKVYVAASSELKAYSFTLSALHKEHVANVVAGRIRIVDKYAPTFSDLAYHSAEIKDPVIIPASINTDASFVVRHIEVSNITNYLQKISRTKPKVLKLKKVSNWKEVSANLDELTKDNKLTKDTKIIKLH